MDNDGLNQSQNTYSEDLKMALDALKESVTDIDEFQVRLQEAKNFLIDKHLSDKASVQEVASVLNKVREELNDKDLENDQQLKQLIQRNTADHLAFSRKINTNSDRLESFQGTVGNHGARLKKVEKGLKEIPNISDIITETLSYLETTDEENKLDALNGLKNLNDAVDQYLKDLDPIVLRDKLEELKEEARLSYKELSDTPDIEKIAREVAVDQIARSPYRPGTNKQLSALTDVDLSGLSVVDGKYVLGSGGGSGHTIQEEGTSLTQRTNLNFIGSTVTAADDSVNDATTVTISSDSTKQDVLAEGAFVDGDKTKLDGIATGATANSSDATLLNRANHTGTQTASTISDFDTEVSNNTDVADNTSKAHTQNTDTGTTSNSFQLNSGSSGVRIKDVSGALYVRNALDNDDADLVVKNLTVNGTTTTVNSETVNIADNVVVLNSDYTGSTPTSDGGIEIERGTLTNASLIWDEASDIWKAGLAGSEVELSLLGHTHTTSDITSGTFADARIAASNVTQHQAALSITESQISDLGDYASKASLTSGYVPYYNGTDLADSDLYDDGAGAIGIGTATPTGTLHIFTGSSGGTASTSADDLVIESSGNSGMTMLTANTARTNFWFADPESPFAGYIQYDHPSDFMRFGTNGTEAIRIDSSQNVGIGTTSPASTLDVAGTITGDGLTIAGTSNLTGDVNISGGPLDVTMVDDDWAFNFSGTANITSASGATYQAIRMVASVDPDNTSSLINLYNLNNNLRPGGSGSPSVTNTILVNAQVLFDDAYGGTHTNLYNLRAVNPVNLGTGSPTITNLVGVQIHDLDYGTNNYGIRSQVSSGTNKYNIYANGTADNYFAGDVGIGTTTPNHTLDVSGNIGISASGYLNWGTTTGSTGYGIRDNAGAIEAKNSGGSWIPVVTTTGTQTLTNKRVTPRVGTTTSSATITPTGDSSDVYTVTALATNATIASPSGTPNNGQRLMIRIKDNGTSRTLTWNAIYRVIGTTLPTATTASKTIYVGCIYNSADTKWDVVAVTEEA